MAFRFLAPWDRPFAEPRETVSSSSDPALSRSRHVFCFVSVLHAQFLQVPPLVCWRLSQFVSVVQLVAPQPVQLVAPTTPASLAEAVQVGM